MSCAEHIIENAIYAIGEGKTFEEWAEREPNKDCVKSDLAEIWDMALYVYYADFTRSSLIDSRAKSKAESEKRFLYTK